MQREMTVRVIVTSLGGASVLFVSLLNKRHIVKVAVRNNEMEKRSEEFNYSLRLALISFTCRDG